MIINYDEKELSDALQDFYNATGVNLQLLKPDFSFFCKKNRLHNDFCKAIQSCTVGKKACFESDVKLIEKCKKTRRAEIQICHAGLMDVCVPITYDNSILGYIILGQMKYEEDFTKLNSLLSHLPVSLSTMKEHYKNLPIFEHSRIMSVAKVAVMLAEHILFRNMLKPEYNHIIEKATDFIDKNLSSPLSVAYITKSINISRSTLYKNFHLHFNCTLSEYINKKRIENSIKLLIETDLSIEEIAQNSGFSNSAYYTKIFKRLKGISPLKYRKSERL